MSLNPVIQKTLLAISGAATLLSAPSAHSAASIAAGQNRDGSHISFWKYNATTAEAAKKTALAACNKELKKVGAKGKCTEVMRHNGPVFFAIVKSEPGTTSQMGFAYSPDRQTAINLAYESCVSGGQYQCKGHASHVFWDGGPANIPEPQQATATQQIPSLSERAKEMEPAMRFESRFTEGRYSKPGEGWRAGE